MNELIEGTCLNVLHAARCGDPDAVRACAFTLLELTEAPPPPRTETVVQAEGPEHLNYVLTLSCGHKRTFTTVPQRAIELIGSPLYCPTCGGTNGKS